MLLSSKRIICVLITLLLFISSCSIGGSDNNTNNNTTLSNQGSVSIQLPTILSFVESTKPKNSDSRAILSSEDIKIKVFKDGNYLKTVPGVYQKDVMVSHDDFDNNSYFNFKLEPGTYSIEVNIYNPHQEDTPVVKGTSQEFEVLSNETVDVEIVAAPVDPEAIEIGKEFTLNKSDYIATTLNEFGGVNTGSEKWFSFTTTTDLTKIDIKSDVEDISLFLILYNQEGNYKLINRDFIFPTQPGETYYLGTAYIDFPQEVWGISIDRDLIDKTITVAPFVDVEDNNASMETAEQLSVGEAKLLELDKSNDLDFFKVNLTKDCKYRISFNFDREVSEKFIYNEAGDVIFNFINEWDNITDEFIYVPAEDETIYISVNLNYETYNQYWNPALIISDISNPAMHFYAWDEYFLIEGYKVEARVINNDDGTFTTQTFEIESWENEWFYREFEDVTLQDNVSLVFILKGLNDETLGVTEKFDLRELAEPYIYLYFYSDYLNIDQTPGSQLPSITGEEVTTYFSITEHIYSDVLEVKEGDITIKATVVKAPEDSQLLDQELEVTYDELEEVYSFSYATDISGKYEIVVEASNAYSTNTLWLSFLTKEETEGVLNVTFE